MTFKLGLAVAAFAVGCGAGATELPRLVLPEGLGVNIHFSRGHTQDLDMIAAAGVKWVRMDFGWAGIEREKGSYDWSAYDELTENLQQRGLGAVYILDYSNPLYEDAVVSKNPIHGEEHRDTASPQHPASVEAFAHWAAAAAEHFRGKHIIWEIWNEPNITFWKPKPDVAQYSQLALATCRAVRKAVPEATLVGPATSGIPLDFLGAFFKSGVLEYLDAVSVHPYRSYSKSPETALADYEKLRELMARYRPAGKPPLPILSGEWGYASHIKGVAEDLQAAYLIRQQLVNELAGVPLSIWYDWKNDGQDPAEREDNFGTVTYDLTPKPAYRALQTFTRELGGYQVTRRLTTERDQDYLLLCTRAKDQKLVAWTTSPTNSVSLYATESLHPTQIRDIYGRAVPAEHHPKGVALNLGLAPVYVLLAPGTAAK